MFDIIIDYVLCRCGCKRISKLFIILMVGGCFFGEHFLNRKTDFTFCLVKSKSGLWIQRVHPWGGYLRSNLTPDFSDSWSKRFLGKGFAKSVSDTQLPCDITLRANSSEQWAQKSLGTASVSSYPLELHRRNKKASSSLELYKLCYGFIVQSSNCFWYLENIIIFWYYYHEISKNQHNVMQSFT